MRKIQAFAIMVLVSFGCQRPSVSENGAIFGVDPGTPTLMAEARFNYPEDAIEAPDGSIYLSDTHSHVIRHIKDGVVSVFAGTLNAGFNGDGHRLTTSLNLPTALLFSNDGQSLHFADSGNRLIRKINMETGAVEIVAGKPSEAMIAQDGANARHSPIGWVSAMKLGSDGSICFPAAHIENERTIGGGIFCLLSDGKIRKMQFNVPFEMHKVRDISIGLSSNDFTLDTNFYRYFHDGTLKKTTITSGFGKGIEQDWRGSLVGSHTSLLHIDHSLKVSTVASGFANISNIKPTKKGYLITDSDQGAIYSLESGEKKQLTGTAPARNGALVDVSLYDENTLLILDNQMPRIFRYDLRTGIASHWAGTGTQGWASINVDKLKTNFYYPAAIAVDANKNVYVAEQHRIMKIDVAGLVSLFAGYETPGDIESQNPPNARMQGIRGMTFDVAGNMYVADTYNNKVRKIAPNGRVETFAGTGEAAAPLLGVPATESPLNRPHSVLPLTDGSVLIADTWNNAVLRIDGNGITHPFAGVPTYGHYQGMGAMYGDEGVAKEAQLNGPVALAHDKEGNIFIADHFNHRIRVVSRNGKIRTFAGDTQGYAPSGKRLNFPAGVVTINEQIFVADSGNRLVVRYHLR